MQQRASFGDDEGFPPPDEIADETGKCLGSFAGRVMSSVEKQDELTPRHAFAVDTSELRWRESVARTEDHQRRHVEFRQSGLRLLTCGRLEAGQQRAALIAQFWIQWWRHRLPIRVRIDVPV